MTINQTVLNKLQEKFNSNNGLYDEALGNFLKRKDQEYTKFIESINTLNANGVTLHSWKQAFEDGLTPAEYLTTMID